MLYVATGCGIVTATQVKLFSKSKGKKGMVFDAEGNQYEVAFIDARQDLDEGSDIYGQYYVLFEFEFNNEQFGMDEQHEISAEELPMIKKVKSPAGKVPFSDFEWMNCHCLWTIDDIDERIERFTKPQERM
ncbi:hypothetical protein [Rummeliibacillus stabekisii]|uniref:hypothetical protein n=1 Tax=Rummeliibacillus stabekisii TaxID=241244 RepID=UPI0037224CCF